MGLYKCDQYDLKMVPLTRMENGNDQADEKGKINTLP